jgi:hypothetical protein
MHCVPNSLTVLAKAGSSTLSALFSLLSKASAPFFFPAELLPSRLGSFLRAGALDEGGEAFFYAGMVFNI